MMPIVWTSPALEDLTRIVEYVRRDSAVYADVLAEDLVLAAEQLQDFPKSGRMVPEVGRASVRELIVRSYRLVYRLRLERIEILALLHGARDSRRLWRKLRGRG